MLVTYTDKKVWARECARKGAINHLSEITSYTDLGQESMQEYALGKGNSGMYGVWHPVRKSGVVYSHVRNCFSTKGRKFVQEKITVYM